LVFESRTPWRLRTDDVDRFRSLPAAAQRERHDAWSPVEATVFDRVGLGHNTFTEDALALLVRSSEGILRRTRNLCLSALIEAVRDQTRTVELKQVNRVLTQPHWRKDYDLTPV